jgi:hypothetical protein
MVAFGTKRASRDRVPMSAFGDNAEITAYDPTQRLEDELAIAKT